MKDKRLKASLIEKMKDVLALMSKFYFAKDVQLFLTEVYFEIILETLDVRSAKLMIKSDIENYIYLSTHLYLFTYI